MLKRRKPLYWVLGIVLLIILIGVIPNWIVEWLWLGGVDYQEIFWKIKGTQFLLFFGALIIALAYILSNMQVLAKNISFLHLNFANTPFEEAGDKYINGKQIRRILFVAGGVFSLFFSTNYFFKWDEWFRFIKNKSFDSSDPVFGQDIGFYTFRLPFLESMQNSLIALVSLVLIMSLIAYYIKGYVSIKSLRFRGAQPSSAAIKHLSVNLGFWFLLFAWGFYLKRYSILFDPDGAVMGAGYTDVKVLLPVLWVLVGLSFIMAILAFYQMYRLKVDWLLKGIGVLFIIGVVGQAVLPWSVRSISVKPNELKMEEPYLKNNIELTREAYGLDKFHETSYGASDTLTYPEIQNNIQTVDNIRLWDPRPIIETYRQLQEIRLYYTFPSVSINRYHTNQGYKQVMVSGRELNTAKLPEKSQTWVNRHLQYTHGYGLTMSPVAETNSEGSPKFLIKDLPPVSNIDIELTNPAIYYGETTSEYKLVNTEIKELDYPKGKENVYTHYEGRGGVAIDNMSKKALFSLFFSDYNLMLTKYIKSGSKIQFWREIQPRIKKTAPFLELKDDPYLVVDEGKLYWIQDAYTTAGNYPYAQPYSYKNSYIRNSVKVVVDAYHGDVDFYIADEEDPVLEVYRSVFPDMFQSIEDMPGNLKQHVRYPNFLFDVQMELYKTYHMTNPQTFYNNEDLWKRPNAKYAGSLLNI